MSQDILQVETFDKFAINIQHKLFFIKKADSYTLCIQWMEDRDWNDHYCSFISVTLCTSASLKSKYKSKPQKFCFLKFLFIQ